MERVQERIANTIKRLEKNMISFKVGEGIKSEVNYSFVRIYIWERKDTAIRK